MRHKYANTNSSVEQNEVRYRQHTQLLDLIACLVIHPEVDLVEEEEGGVL